MFKDYLNMYYLPIDIILIILIINFIIYIFSIYYKETHNNPLKVLFNKGLTGEYLTYLKLNKLKGYKKFIFNKHIKFDENKETEIDIIMIHETGIYVIESKNYSGLILGNNNDKWTQVLGNGQRYSFYNPIKQNNTHIKAIKYYLGDSSNYFYPIVVFSNECELRVNNKNVLNRRDLLTYINKLNNNNYLTNKDIDKAYKMFKVD